MFAVSRPLSLSLFGTLQAPSADSVTEQQIRRKSKGQELQQRWNFSRTKEDTRQKHSKLVRACAEHPLLWSLFQSVAAAAAGGAGAILNGIYICVVFLQYVYGLNARRLSGNQENVIITFFVSFTQSEIHQRGAFIVPSTVCSGVFCAVCMGIQRVF